MLRKNRELRQTSETFLLSAILALSGGFQDAYTYNARDEVFSNAQTGNVVLMSQHLMMGDFKIALRYLFPLIAFALGVLVAERISHRYKNASRIHWRQIVVLVEIVILFAVGFIPVRFNLLATMLVSFACSMQVQKGKWLRLCQHDVYRKSPKRNGESVGIPQGQRVWGTQKGHALLWNHHHIRTWRRSWRRVHAASGVQVDLDIQCTSYGGTSHDV